MSNAPSTRLHLNLISEALLNEDGSARPIHILRTGTFTGSTGVPFTFEPSHLQEIVQHFQEGRRKRPPVTERHDWGRAVGRLERVWMHADSLYALPKWNPTGRQLLADEVYDGFSCEIETTDAGLVLIGGSLTNYPAVDGLEPVTLTAPPPSLQMEAPMMDACIAACQACEQACLAAAQATLGPGSESLVQTLLRCAEMCSRCEECLDRGDMSMCGACVAACQQCADACAAYGDTLNDCVAACRACMAACQALMPPMPMYESAPPDLPPPMPAAPVVALSSAAPPPPIRKETVPMSDPTTPAVAENPPLNAPPTLPTTLDAYTTQMEARIQAREEAAFARAQALFEQRIQELDQRNAIETFSRAKTVTSLNQPWALPCPAEELSALLVETPAGPRAKWMQLLNRITASGLLNFDEIGSSAEGAEAADQWNALVSAKQGAGMSRVQAIQETARQHPELYAAQTRVKKGGR